MKNLVFILGSPSHELAALTEGKYQKGSGSREIGRYLHSDTNMSHSFKVFVQGIRKLIHQDLSN